jgi:hypothetical protein
MMRLLSFRHGQTDMLWIISRAKHYHLLIPDYLLDTPHWAALSHADHSVSSCISFSLDR